MNIVVRCGCGGVQTYVKSTMTVFSLPDPDSTHVGKEKIRSLAQKYQGTSFAEHLEAIAKKSGRYAFYISTTGAPTDSEQSITAMYNLISAKKVY